MTKKKKRIIHFHEFKTETLKLSEKVGVAAAARQLSLRLEQDCQERYHNQSARTGASS